MTPWDTKTAAGTRTIYPVAQHCRVAPGAEKTALTEWIFPHPLKPEQPTPRALPLTKQNPVTDFQPVTKCTRKPGTGCISDLNDHLLGGRYLPARPDGTKHFKPVYVHTREECEEELKVLIRQMNAERKAVQDRLQGITPPCELHKKERQIWAYMKFHPEETNMNVITKGAKATMHMVAKHY
ncbi:hypothetical protein NSA43_07940 [Intestinimonas butyriciproducens]|uniref:Uncharacterized protein n=1 Tax=Intestinimonas butyriciproducens TaxID=1297617 RepID=A0A2U1CDN5_9FIRM|nr:hypothetical protein [Intestinimonas butyriciproducens]MCR1905959.1 hypothetical protein [Intestinimonas butyriciproducens]PVY59016.1 hypothetical protein C7373_103308 [Intestinimonas butyriciproducens]